MPRQHATDFVRTSFPLLHYIPAFPLLRFLILLSVLLGSTTPAQAAPQLWLPTPPGETWTIIQGYACGTHNSWDRYSLDLANRDGRTYGAPVRAAADGRIWSWTPKSGTLILSHGDGFYTMYTHMSSVVSTQRDKFVARGTVIGTVGDRGSPGTPHLHFTAFTGHGISASGRQSVELHFAEVSLPEVGGCNQHGGTKVTADGNAQPLPEGPPSIEFAGGEPGRWYSGDVRIDFGGNVTAFSQAWDDQPSEAEPQFKDASTGYIQLSWAGEGLHTLYVRAWGGDDSQIVAEYGPIGYDIPPPTPPAQIEPITVVADQPTALEWEPATDNASGVAGYRVYVGADPKGTSEWFTPTPSLELPALSPGNYVVRVQTIDYADNASEWITLGEIISAPSSK